MACGRSSGPHPGETVGWAVTALEVTGEGCGDAAPVVEAVGRVYAPGTGLAYVVSEDGRSAETLACPLADGGFDLEACQPQGDLGVVREHAVDWVLEELVADDPPCRFVLTQTRRIVDRGDVGDLTVTVDATATEQAACGYTFEGMGVRPDGCRVTASGELEWIDALD